MPQLKEESIYGFVNELLNLKFTLTALSLFGYQM